MYSVLIVDDDDHKIAKLAELIEGLIPEPSLQRHGARNANEAVLAMTEREYDLVVLDVNLPMRQGDAPRRDGGVQLLNTIFRQGVRLKRPKRIVGLTAYAEIHATVVDTFSSQGVQLILYDEESQSWTGPLSNAISYQLGIGGTGDSTPFDEDICIVTALKAIELEAVLKLPAEWTTEVVDGDDTQYFRGTFKRGAAERSVIAAAALEMGMAAAACLATKMIYTFRPRYLCMCGITAGIGMNFGDIVVAERSWNYNNGKYVTDEAGRLKFLPEPRHVTAAANVSERMGVYLATRKDALPRIQSSWEGNAVPTVLRVQMGPMATGAAVVENQEVIDGLREQNRKTAAVEMEAYGVFMAGQTCSKPQPEVIVVKSICDFGIPPKTDDFQRYAAFTSAQFLHEIMLDCMP